MGQKEKKDRMVTPRRPAGTIRREEWSRWETRGTVGWVEAGACRYASFQKLKPEHMGQQTSELVLGGGMGGVVSKQHLRGTFRPA